MKHTLCIKLSFLNKIGVSAGKRDQIEIFFKKKFLSKIDVDLIIWSRTFIISKKNFLSIWSLFPALTPYMRILLIYHFFAATIVEVLSETTEENLLHPTSSITFKISFEIKSAVWEYNEKSFSECIYSLPVGKIKIKA